MIEYRLLAKNRTLKKKMEKVTRLQSFVVSYCHKYMDKERMFKNYTDDLAKRRKLHMMWTQLIILNKMYAIAVADLVSVVYRNKRYIERYRDKMKDQALLSHEFKWNCDMLETLDTIGWQHGQSVLKIAYTLRDPSNKLTAKEIQAALSISEIAWEKHRRECKKQKVEEWDLIHIILVAQLGPSALSQQVMVAASDMVLSDPKNLQIAKHKAEQMFPQLFT